LLSLHIYKQNALFGKNARTFGSSDRLKRNLDFLLAGACRTYGKMAVDYIQFYSSKFHIEVYLPKGLALLCKLDMIKDKLD
jgi:hypothetical protein